MVNITGQISNFLSCRQKGDLHNMAEIEKKAVGFPVMHHLWLENLNKVAAPYF